MSICLNPTDFMSVLRHARRLSFFFKLFSKKLEGECGAVAFCVKVERSPWTAR